jgi:transcriptional/translational regulatory protein YebC/TACO1
MSGHSKWHKIKHKKETTDGKKSQLFGRLSREISTLARRNADPSANAPLREAIERAKKVNLPQENI